MFLGMLLFELRRRIKRVSTWLYFAIFALFGFMGVYRASVGRGLLARLTLAGRGNIEADAPYAIYYFVTLLSAYGLLLAAAIFGRAGSRDFDENFHPLCFTYPTGKMRYIGARFAGALAATMIVLSGTGWGALLGTISPWTDSAKIGDIRLLAYIQPYLVSALPNVLFAGALFFALAILSRRFLPVWAGLSGIAVLYGISMALLRGENRLLAALLDPSGLIASRLVYSYWSVAEKNTLLMPLAGPLLANRLLWTGLAAAILIVMHRRFKFAVPEERESSFVDSAQAGSPASDPKMRFIPGAFGTPPEAARRFGIRRDIACGVYAMRDEFSHLVRRKTFYVVLALGLAMVLVVGFRGIGVVRGTQTFPVTSQVLAALCDSLYFLGVLLILFASGALVHRERDGGMKEMFDAYPAPSWVPLFGKIGALWLALLLSLVLVMAGGMAIQTLRGWRRFEPMLYVQELFGIRFVYFALIAVLAVFAQVLTRKKFIGYLVTLFFIDEFFETFGLEHHLWTYASTPAHTYSDMNGYGPFVSAIVAYDLYWISLAIVLAVMSILLYQRGLEDRFVKRLAAAKLLWTRRTAVITTGATASCIMIGAWVVYNTVFLNPFETEKKIERRRADYEKTYKRWERRAQPHVAAVDARIDLYPEERRVEAAGVLRLSNRSNAAVETLLVQVPRGAAVRELRPEVEAMLVSADSLHGVLLFALDEPLGPGEETALRFSLARGERGFKDRNVDTRLVENGSFLTVMHLLPATGYDPYGQYELDDDDARKRQGLPPKPRMAQAADTDALMRTPLGAQADWIDFEAIVSTAGDQTALAPGELVREWEENGRRFFHYRAPRKILRYVAVLSGKYEVERGRWNDVGIEVYHHPGHDYNVDLMIEGVGRSLEYFSKEWTPYQFSTVRIVEFPRYEIFAEAFAGLIPLSEGYGFIAKYDEGRVKEVFRVMAHEVGHQWWAHQVIGADVEGFFVLTEVMAQYSALAVSKRAYDRALFDEYVRYEIDRYLRGRGSEVREEVPLVRTNEETWYQNYAKGFAVMNALAEYVGEERVNGAIRAFMERNAFQGPPFPTAGELVERFREAAPDSLRYLVADCFERIVLYDNEALAATCEPAPGGGYDVAVSFKAQKWEADAAGKETPLPLHDLVEFGAYDEKGEELCRRRVWVTGGTGEIRMTVDRRPARAGIDPHYLLMDKKTGNNVIDVAVN